MGGYLTGEVCGKLRRLLMGREKNARLIATHLLAYFGVDEASFALMRKERMHYVVSYCLEQDPRNAQAREKYNVGKPHLS